MAIVEGSLDVSLASLSAELEIPPAAVLGDFSFMATSDTITGGIGVDYYLEGAVNDAPAANDWQLIASWPKLTGNNQADQLLEGGSWNITECRAFKKLRVNCVLDGAVSAFDGAMFYRLAFDPDGSLQ